MTVAKSLLVWLCFIPLAIVNGGARDFLLTSVAGQWALPLSGVTLSLLILLTTWALLPRLGKLSTKVRLQIGGLWLLLTLTFETVTGLAQGHTPAELLTAYDPATGNLWLLVLLTTAIAPVVVRRKAESSEKKR